MRNQPFIFTTDNAQIFKVISFNDISMNVFLESLNGLYKFFGVFGDIIRCNIQKVEIVLEFIPFDDSVF